MIVRKELEPSREDAVRLNRGEKQSMIVFAYVATVYEDMQKELADRLKMVRDGPLRMNGISADADALLNELRKTIPMNQRLNLQRTIEDYEMRLVPKATPGRTTVVMAQDEFKALVDAARVKCRECTEDSKACTKCELYQLLTVVVPLDDYDGWMLCPYNMGEWK